HRHSCLCAFLSLSAPPPGSHRTAYFEHVQISLDTDAPLSYFEHVQKEPAMYIVSAYIAYLLISLGVTVWVARTLHKNGRVFLIDAFHNNAPLADSVNHLLVVGFYLINIG